MKINFNKFPNKLVPAIIQDAVTKNVLMLGYMNNEALKQTMENNRVTFYSRSKERLWTKGEESGNYLEVINIKSDCDNDAMLIEVNPVGGVCHLGSDTCWNERNISNFGFLSVLEDVIKNRKNEAGQKESYVASLFQKGINKVAQKVGEEAVEMVIEAKDDDDNAFINESADLLFHYMILLEAKGFTLGDVERILKERHKMDQ